MKNFFSSTSTRWVLISLLSCLIAPLSIGSESSLQVLNLEIDQSDLRFLNFSSPGIIDNGSTHTLTLLENGNLIVGGNNPAGIGLKVEVQGLIGAESFCDSNENSCLNISNVPTISDPWEVVSGGIRLPAGVSMGIGHPSGLPEHPLTASFEIYSQNHNSQYQTSFHFDVTTSKFRTAASTTSSLKSVGSGRTATLEDGTSAGQFNLTGTKPFEFWAGVSETISGIAPMSVADGRKIGIFNDNPSAQMDISRPSDSTDKYLIISSAMGQNGDIFNVSEQGFIGLKNSDPKAHLDINGFARLSVHSSAPFVCNATVRGSIAISSNYQICICNSSEIWVLNNDGVTSCAW